MSVSETLGSRRRLWFCLSNTSWPQVMLFVGAVTLYAIRYATATQTGVTGDDARYLVLAESFVTGRPYRVISFPNAPLETVFPPGYPLFVLAPVAAIFGMNYQLLRATSVVLACGNVLLVYNLLARYISDKTMLLVVVSLFALNNSISGLAGMAMSETAFIFFLLLHLILLHRLLSDTGTGNKTFTVLLCGLTLSVAVLVRYQGLALVAASVICLLSSRRYKDALLISCVFLLFMSFFALFMAVNGLVSAGSLLATQVAQRQIQSFCSRLGSTVFRYATAIPLVMVPVFGPRLMDAARSMGLAWLINGFHLLLFGVTIFEIARGLTKREPLAAFSFLYIALIFVIDNHGVASVHNESRYSTVILPFLYMYFIRFLLYIGKLIMRDTQTLRKAAIYIGSILVAAILLRNVQQISSQFTVVDLSAGAEWVKQHTEEGATILTHDAIERYIYLRRHTLELSTDSYTDLPSSLWAKYRPDYLLIAPTLRTTDGEPNVKQALDPLDEKMLLPMVRQDSHFQLVWADEKARTYLYRVQTE